MPFSICRLHFFGSLQRTLEDLPCTLLLSTPQAEKYSYHQTDGVANILFSTIENTTLMVSIFLIGEKVSE